MKYSNSPSFERLRRHSKLLLAIGTGIFFIPHGHSQNLDPCLPSTVCEISYMPDIDPPNNPNNKEGYDLIFFDEFTTGETGQDPNFPTETIERPDWNNWSRANRIKQATEIGLFGASKQNVRVENGSMILTAEKEVLSLPYTVPGSGVYTYYDVQHAGADLRTNPSVGTEWYRTPSPKTFKYGYFEIRCKVPKSRHVWPGFWFHGGGKEVDENENGVIDTHEKTNTEIDMFEMFPTEKGCSQIPMNYHFRDLEHLVDLSDETGDPAHNINQGGQIVVHPHDEDFTDVFHTFALDWTPTKITWLVDNHPVRVLENVPGQNGGLINVVEAIYDQRLGLLLGMVFKTDDFTYSNFDQELEMTEDVADFVIDYVRIYRKKPGIIPAASNCKTGLMRFSANYEGDLADHQFIWTVSDPTKAMIWGPNSGATVEVQMLPGYTNSFVELILTDIDYDHKMRKIDPSDPTTFGIESTNQITIPGIVPEFDLSDVTCGANGLEVTVNALHTVTNASDYWYLHEVVSGVLQYPALAYVTGPSYTFNATHGLANGNVYSVIHQVAKKKCMPLTESEQDFEVNYGAFEVVEPFCEGGQLEIKTTVDDPSITSTWYLLGQWTGAILQQQTAVEANFQVTNAFNYVIKREFNGCGSNFEILSDVVTMPNYPVQPEFHATATVFGTYHIISTNYTEENPSGFTHWWGLYSSDVNQTLGTQVPGTSIIYSENAGWLIPYDPSKYYAVIHGVYGECTNWESSINYIHQETMWRSNEVSDDVRLDISQNNAELDFTLFPNPSNGSFEVALNRKVETPMMLSVTDASGREVYNAPLSNTIHQVDLSTYSKGMYYVTVAGGTISKIKKVVIH